MNVAHVKKGVYIYVMSFEAWADQVHLMDDPTERAEFASKANPIRMLNDQFAQIIAGESATRQKLIELFQELDPKFNEEKDVFFVNYESPEPYWKIQIKMI